MPVRANPDPDVTCYVVAVTTPTQPVPEPTEPVPEPTEPEPEPTEPEPEPTEPEPEPTVDPLSCTATRACRCPSRGYEVPRPEQKLYPDPVGGGMVCRYCSCKRCPAGFIDADGDPTNQCEQPLV